MSHLNIVFVLVIVFHFSYAGKVFGSIMKWVVYMKYKGEESDNNDRRIM